MSLLDCSVELRLCVASSMCFFRYYTLSHGMLYTPYYFLSFELLLQIILHHLTGREQALKFVQHTNTSAHQHNLSQAIQPTMDGSSNHNQPMQLPPLDLGTPWMPIVVTAKMHQIHEEISPSNTTTLRRRNALRCPAGSVTIVDREGESCSLKRTNAVRRKRANTGATELSADSTAETEASATKVHTQGNFHHDRLQNAVNYPQTSGALRPSRFIEHVVHDDVDDNVVEEVDDDVDSRKEVKSRAGVSKAVSKMKAGLKGMLR